MNTLDTVLLALGAGDRAQGARLALIGAMTAVPAWLAIAVLLAIGPGR